METEIYSDVPCSSIAVESIVRLGTGGLLWGLCTGPYDSNQLGLKGIARASFVAKMVGRYGFQCGLFAGIFSLTHCGLRRYRRKKDWLLQGGKWRHPHSQAAWNLVIATPCHIPMAMLKFTSCQNMGQAMSQVNALIAGGVAGAAIGAGTRNWKQVATVAGFLSVFCSVADKSREI